jgi:hypothetical protein
VTRNLGVTWATRPSSGLSKDTAPLGFTSISAAPVVTGACLVSCPGAFPWCLNYIRPPKNAEGCCFLARCISREVTAVSQLLFAPRFEEPTRLRLPTTSSSPPPLGFVIVFLFISSFSATAAAVCLRCFSARHSCRLPS